mgnify:CR=1 FL=1
MRYKHSCVLDADHKYKTLVLVRVDADPETGGDRETVLHYALQAGETLAEATPLRAMLRLRGARTADGPKRPQTRKLPLGRRSIQRQRPIRRKRSGSGRSLPRWKPS